jgi:hypothetical protein
VLGDLITRDGGGREPGRGEEVDVVRDSIARKVLLIRGVNRTSTTQPGRGDHVLVIGMVVPKVPSSASPPMTSASSKV